MLGEGLPKFYCKKMFDFARGLPSLSTFPLERILLWAAIVSVFLFNFIFSDSSTSDSYPILDVLARFKRLSFSSSSDLTPV